tara:strand:+ start:413 stop:997 length:585 start_codon:yes stop_codon:yes gene_type:complete
MLFNIGNNNNKRAEVRQNIRPQRRMGVVLPPRQDISYTSKKPTDEKIYWGRPTWIFFHTLVEKVNEEHFSIVKPQLCEFIVKICHNLPCPICAKHAREYMNSVNFNNITTKRALKRMLFDFHNEVNARKKYKQFDINMLDSTYSTAHLIRAFNNFIKNYHMNGSVRFMVETAKRKKIVTDLSKWFKSKLIYFTV